MGMYINEKGQISYRKGEEANGKSYASPNLLKEAAKMAQDVGGTAVKAAAIGTVAVGATAAISTGGTTAALTVAGGITATAVAAEVMREDEEKVVETSLESAKGGENYEQVLQKYANATNESAEIATEAASVKTDPFEAFRQCMGNAGMDDFTQEVTVDTACLPQKTSRQQSGFSLS